MLLDKSVGSTSSLNAHCFERIFGQPMVKALLYEYGVLYIKTSPASRPEASMTLILIDWFTLWFTA